MSVNLFLEVKRCLVICFMCWAAEEDQVDEGDERDDGADVAATYILSYG